MIVPLMPRRRSALTISATKSAAAPMTMTPGLGHRSDLPRGGVQAEHTPLHQRIGRRKSAHRTLAVGIAGVKEADFWLLHHSAQMFRNRARLRGDRRQRAKIVFIARC